MAGTMNLLVYSVWPFLPQLYAKKKIIIIKLYKQETKYTNKASAQTTDKQGSRLENITHRALKHTNDK